MWSSRATRSLARLPEKVAAAAIEFVLSRLPQTPQRAGKPLRSELSGVFSARLGDYRVLYEIDDGRRRVTVLEVTHRSNVYRRR